MWADGLAVSDWMAKAMHPAEMQVQEGYRHPPQQLNSRMGCSRFAGQPPCFAASCFLHLLHCHCPATVRYSTTAMPPSPTRPLACHSPRLPVLGIDGLHQVQHVPLQLLNILAGGAAPTAGQVQAACQGQQLRPR